MEKEKLLLNSLLHVYLMQRGPSGAGAALYFKNQTDDSYNVNSCQDFNVERVCGILEYASWRTDGVEVGNLTQMERLILDSLVHEFLVTTKLKKVSLDLRIAIDLKITTTLEKTLITNTISWYTSNKINGGQGYVLPADYFNRAANSMRTRIAGQYHGYVPPADYFNRAANSMRTSTAGQYHGGLSLNQQYNFRVFPQAGHPFRNQHDANSAFISTAGQSGGLSDSEYQFFNSQQHNFNHS